MRGTEGQVPVSHKISLLVILGRDDNSAIKIMYGKDKFRS